MSKPKKNNLDEWTFFLDADGHIRYNPKCTHCIHGCRQSFRAKIIFCPKYSDRQYVKKADRRRIDSS